MAVMAMIMGIATASSGHPIAVYGRSKLRGYAKKLVVQAGPGPTTPEVLQMTLFRRDFLKAAAAVGAVTASVRIRNQCRGSNRQRD